MTYKPQNPLIVQSDMTVLLETMGELYEPARDFLAQFAELKKSPEYLHTYEITPLSLWNAAAAGLDCETIFKGFDEYSKYEIPSNVRNSIRETIGKFGRLRLVKKDDAGTMALVSTDAKSIRDKPDRLARNAAVPGSKLFLRPRCIIKPGVRGRIKQALIKMAFPVEDAAGFVTGDPLPFQLRERTLGGVPFACGSTSATPSTCSRKRRHDGRQRRARASVRRRQDGHRDGMHGSASSSTR
jgi:DNA excision repair protein ERCC-3